MAYFILKKKKKEIGFRVTRDGISRGIFQEGTINEKLNSKRQVQGPK